MYFNPAGKKIKGPGGGKEIKGRATIHTRVVPNWVKFHILIYLSPLHKCPIKEGFLTSWGVKSNKKPCRQNYRVAMGIFLLP